MKFQIKTLLLVFAIGLASCGTEEFVGSGTEAKEERSISGVDNLDISGIIDLETFQSDDFFLEVTADDNLLTKLITSSTGSTLKIELEDGTYKEASFSVRVGLPTIVGIDKSGTGNLVLTGFEDLAQLDIDQSGTGEMTFTGSANTLTIDKSGTGDFNGFDFPCVSIEFDQSGTGDSEVRCSDSLSGSLSGIGNISFKGTPTVDVEVSGIGEVIDAN